MQTSRLKYTGRMNGSVRQECPDQLKQSSVRLHLLIQPTEAGVPALIRPLTIFTFVQFQEIHAELSPIGTLMFVHSSVLLSLLSRKSLDLPLGVSSIQGLHRLVHAPKHRACQ